MRHILRLLLACLVFASFAGCEKAASHKSPGRYIADKSVAMKDLKSEDVLLVVNGVELKKTEYEQRLRVIERIYRLKKGLGKELYTKDLKRHLESSSRRIPAQMLKSELLQQGALRSGIKANSADLKEAYLNFTKVTGKGKWSEGEIVRRFGAEDGAFLANMITNEAIAIAFRRASTTNEIDIVTDAEIDRYFAKIKRFDEKSKKNNDKSLARAKKIREEIVSGRIHFDEAADRWAQVSPEHGHKWGEFRLSEFDEGSEIRKWLSSAKAGDISYPIDLDDGLALVGVVSIVPAELPPGLPPEDDYTLVKCTFYAYMYAEKMSREEAMIYLRNEKRQAAQMELAQRLYDSAVIEMPNGDDFFPEKKKKQRTKADRQSEQ